MIAGLSKLKNGVAEALLAINILDILCDSQLINDVNLEGYIAIILANLSYYPNGRRKLLKKCRKNLNLIKSMFIKLKKLEFFLFSFFDSLNFVI